MVSSSRPLIAESQLILIESALIAQVQLDVGGIVPPRLTRAPNVTRVTGHFYIEILVS